MLFAASEELTDCSIINAEFMSGLFHHSLFFPVSIKLALLWTTCYNMSLNFEEKLKKIMLFGDLMRGCGIVPITFQSRRIKETFS